MSVRLYVGLAYGRGSDEYLRGSHGELTPLRDDPVLPVDWYADEPAGTSALIDGRGSPWAEPEDAPSSRLHTDGLGPA
jgi:hypothetical protein